MIEWLSTPIDPTRAHEVGAVVAWHGRLMVASWGFLLPLGVLIARFFKVTPGQDWPRRTDNKLWWHSHLALQYGGGALMLAGVALIASLGGTAARWNAHGLLGYCVLALGISQFLAGWLRGSKGGPTEPRIRGDHYDMTLRRRIFETVHKSVGYAALMLALAAILTGLWHANAPRWMWLAIIAWWTALIAAFVILQRRGLAVDTYQAIWGPDPRHPGNRMKPIGWGVNRPQPAPGE